MLRLISFYRRVCILYKISAPQDKAVYYTKVGRNNIDGILYRIKGQRSKQYNIQVIALISKYAQKITENYNNICAIYHIDNRIY